MLLQTIDRCIVWDDGEFDIPDGQVLYNNEPTDCASIMFVATKAIANEAIGIVSLVPEDGSGACTASIGERTANVFNVGTTSQLEPFYRFLICLEKVPRDSFYKWVHLAFPRLRFALEIGPQIRRFRQDYNSIRETIVDHLAAVNDVFLSLLIAGTQLSDVCAEVKATCGVDISPESPNTHGNPSAMSEREVEFEGESVMCEFHTKLTPTHDRIHFSPTVRTESDEISYLVVGPFADHLTT